MTINLLPFLCEAFSTNRRIYKLIDEVYKLDKIKFYNSAKENEWYIHPISQEGSLEQEEYFKKTLGIILNSEGYEKYIDNIIKKGWHYAYNYSKNNDVIIVEKFLKGLIKKHGGLDNITDDEMNSNIIALIILSKEKIDESSEAFMNYIQSLDLRLKHYKSDCELRVNYNNISTEDLKKIRELKNELFLKFGNFKIMNSHINNKELQKYTSMVDCLFDYENTSLISICDNIKFTDKDIEEILYLWIMGGYDKTKNLEDAAKFLVDMTRIKNFCKAYRNAKEYHFKHNQETMYIELDIAEQTARETKVKLEIEKRKCKELNNKIEDINSKKDEDLIEKLNKLEKENRNLKNDLQENFKNKSELNSLREFIFNLDNKVEDISEPLTTKDMEKINSINAVMVGGTLIWQKRMKVLLPNFKFIAPEALNFDITVLDSVDYIFIYTNYLSHAMYYKIMANAKNKKIFFIKTTNEERVLFQIKNYLKPNKKEL